MCLRKKTLTLHKCTHCTAICLRRNSQDKLIITIIKYCVCVCVCVCCVCVCACVCVCICVCVMYAFTSSLLQLCGVSIMRAGEVLEPALLSVCKEATIGKILIQTNETTGEPAVREARAHVCTHTHTHTCMQLHFLRLPPNISRCHVILMDATIATGAAAIMAIRILLVTHLPLPCIAPNHVTLLSAGP